MSEWSEGPDRDVDDAAVPAEVRQAQIAALVSERSFVRAAELAARLGVSTVTVRADLQALHQQGLVRRVRGGAVPATAAPVERPFEVAALDLAAEKGQIGACAAGLVVDGDLVALDAGTTTTAIAHALVGRQELSGVTVITNALNIALVLEVASPRISIVVTGGTLRSLQHSLVNPLGTVLLERVRPSIAFIGCNGVHPSAGVTNVNLPEAEIKLAMLRAARRPVIVGDGSKLGEIEAAKVCDLAEADLLITDGTAEQRLIDDITAAGCPVTVAPEHAAKPVHGRNS
jgi:DeoR family transcriptional regulator of aga operon